MAFVARKESPSPGLLRRAYAHGKFINHSDEALAEALTYIQFPDGSIGPAVLLEESSSARKAHGDRVIADMLCTWGLQDQPAFKRGVQERKDLRTMAGRMEQHEKETARQKASGDREYRWESICK